MQQLKIKERNKLFHFQQLLEQLDQKVSVKNILVYIEGPQLESPIYTAVTDSVLGTSLEFRIWK